jgi:predicted dienelactone hydrolase
VYTENGLLVDLAEVEKVVDLCDVFTVVFGMIPERLLVDTRSEGEEGPLVALVEPVASVEERFHWLGQRRPAFGPPERFMFFIWPHSIDFLEESGVAARIGRRCEATGHSEAVTMLEKVMAELRQKEQEAILEAIKGDSFRTLWPVEEDASL